MINRLLELIGTKRMTVGEIATELGTTTEVVSEMVNLLDRKGKIVKINTGKGVIITASEVGTMNDSKLTPSSILEFIKSRGFSTISEAAKALGSTPEDVKKMLDFLFTKQHVKRVDVAREHECAGNCSGCHGCEHAAMIQIDGTTISYQLKAHNL